MRLHKPAPCGLFRTDLPGVQLPLRPASGVRESAAWFVHENGFWLKLCDACTVLALAGRARLPHGLIAEVFQRALDALLPAGPPARRAVLAGPGLSVPDLGADILLLPTHPQTGEPWSPTGPTGPTASAYPVPLPFGVWMWLAFPEPHLHLPASPGPRPAQASSSAAPLPLWTATALTSSPVMERGFQLEIADRQRSAAPVPDRVAGADRRRGSSSARRPEVRLFG